MALIEFKNLPDTSTPLNAENLNNNFNELDNSIEKVKNDFNELNKLKGTIAWTNSNESQDFEGQIITINNFKDYRYYEIIYLYSTGSPYTLSTNKLPTDRYGTVLSMIYNAPGNSFHTSRTCLTTNNGLNFGNAYASNNVTANNRCIPSQIIMYE